VLSGGGGEVEKPKTAGNTKAMLATRHADRQAPKTKANQKGDCDENDM